MSTNQRGLLQSQTNAEEPNNNDSSKLIEREKMENTPFWIIGTPGKGYFATFGKYQITENMEEKEEVLLYVQQNQWEIIMKVAGIIAQDIVDQTEIRKQTPMRGTIDNNKNQKQ